MVINPAIANLPDKLCFTWSATPDSKQRKFNYPTNYRYGLNLLINRQTLHVFLLILLAGDIATNPSPRTKPNLHCLSFNAQSIRSSTKLPNGSVTSNMKSFQDMVYAEELDIILMTETRLNDNFSDNEILSSGFNI